MDNVDKALVVVIAFFGVNLLSLLAKNKKKLQRNKLIRRPFFLFGKMFGGLRQSSNICTGHASVN